MTQPKRRKVTGYAIDSPTSKDLDDAIRLKRESDGSYRVTVSISDVSNTVMKGSDVDARAYDRAFTRYFAKRNSPMIPARLADFGLSLVPRQRRDVLVFEIRLDKDLEVTGVSVELGSFWSQRRYTHKQVDDALESKTHKEHRRWSAYYKFAEKLLNKRRQQGAMVIYDLEQGLYTTEEGKVLKKQPGEYFRPYIIVQEFMILVNHTVTVFLAGQGVNLLYRNHAPLVDADGSNQEQVVRELYGAEVVTPDLLVELSDRMKRLAGRARYEASCKGHLGLSLSAYTHWTSPIRRYADLVNHRQVVAWLCGEEPPYTCDQLEEIGTHLNQVYDSVKDQTRYAYAIEAKKEVQNADLDKLMAFSESHFSHFVRMLTREDIPLTEQRAVAVIGRMQDETLPLVDYTCILFTEVPDDILWRQVQKNALQALSAHPTQVRMLLNMAQQKLGWQSSVVSTPKLAGQYESVVSITRRDRTYTSQACSGQGKAESETQAIFDMLRSMHTIQIKLPKKGVKSMASPGNAKGALFEICQQKRWPMPTFTAEQKGPAHQPLFACIGRLKPTGRAELVTDSCQATSRKAAEQIAAKALLAQLDANPRFDKTSEATEQGVAAAVITSWENNPVSALQEYCQKKGNPLPEYTDSQRGTDHQTMFTAACSVIIAGEERTFAGEGSNKKEAKRKAASEACKQVFAAA